jgi:hypothetical protein
MQRSSQSLCSPVLIFCRLALDVIATLSTVNDGDWHQLEIPLTEFATASFEPKNTYEIRLRAIPKTPAAFSVFIDTIRFVTHQPPK